MMPQYRSCIVFSCFLFVFALSCSTQEERAIEQIQIEYQSFSLYKEIAALDTSNYTTGLQKLKSKYPDFLDFYLDTLAGLGLHHNYSPGNPAMISFLSHPDYRQLMDTVLQAFPDTEEQDAALQAMLQRSKYYLPEIGLPDRVYYFVSGLNLYSAVTRNDDQLGIGLDMFLGPHFKPYQSVGIPEYATIRFTPENIPVWAARTVFRNQYPYEPIGATLLDNIIRNGKEIYFLEKVLPDLQPELFLGYTSEQFQWCEEQEEMIYAFFIQNNLLYEKNPQKIMRYVTDGPATPGFPGISPGNLGAFIGWKIVRKFASSKGTDLGHLMAIDQAQTILNQANYRP